MSWLKEKYGSRKSMLKGICTYNNAHARAHTYTLHTTKRTEFHAWNAVELLKKFKVKPCVNIVAHCKNNQTDGKPSKFCHLKVFGLDLAIPQIVLVPNLIQNDDSLSFLESLWYSGPTNKKNFFADSPTFAKDMDQ